MLFVGTITRMIEGDRHKHNHEPAAYPAAACASIPPRPVNCSCRGDISCSACPTRSLHVGAAAPLVAATPTLSHHDARREWRYERRAMRDYRRAVRHGYGYGHPIAIPVATVYGAGQSGYDPVYYEAGPSTPRALPDHRRDEYRESRDRVQHEAPPPRYETISWDPRRTSVEGLAEGKGA